MKSVIRNEFLVSIENEFGQLHRIGKSNSLFGVQDKARLYVRYSKLHHRGSTFFGLRQEDLGLLEAFAISASIIVIASSRDPKNIFGFSLPRKDYMGLRKPP